MKNKIIYILIFFILVSCNDRYYYKIKINEKNKIFIVSEVGGFGGGDWNITVKLKHYFNTKEQIIDFGDQGDPMIYKVTNNKINIYLTNNNFDIPEQMKDIIDIIEISDGIQYVNLIDSIKKGLKQNYEIYYPFDFIKTKYNVPPR